MANRTIYEILAKAVGFEKSEKKVKGLNGALGGLAKKALAVGGAYFGARALLDGVNASIEAFGKQEQAEKMLEQALGRTSQALLDHASALQQNSVFGDEAVIAQQAFLASIGMTEDQIKDILPVAADLAAATGMTLESAVRNTAKTFSGLAGELGELVPQLRDLTAEEMKAGEAVKVMADLFGGTASAQAATLSGKLDRVKNVVGDIVEDMGSKLAPAIESVADAVLILSGAVEEDTSLEARIENIDNAIAMTEKLRETDDKFMVAKHTASIQELEDKKMQLEEQIKMREDAEIMHTQFIDNSLAEIETKELLTQKDKELAEQEKKREKTRQQLAKISESVISTANTNIMGSLSSLVDAHGGSSKTVKNLTIAQAIADTYAGANSALREGTGVFKWVEAAAIVAQGLANVKQIDNAYQRQKAQYGFEGVVSEPTQFTVGEGGASEYVSVQPMEGVNNATAQGVTVNISGNVMSEQFVEEELAERISEAVRKGVDFGMS